jgi:hypothetical protein
MSTAVAVRVVVVGVKERWTATPNSPSSVPPLRTRPPPVVAMGLLSYYFTFGLPTSLVVLIALYLLFTGQHPFPRSSGRPLT